MNRPEFQVTAKALGVTPEDRQSYTLSTNLARRWMSRQADEHGIEGLDFAVPVQSLQNGHARLFFQDQDESFSFALAHEDDRDSGTKWRILGAIEQRGDRAHLAVEVSVETNRRYVIPPLGMPSFLAEIIANVGLEDVWPLTIEPLVITTDNAADFVALIRDPRRRLPIIAFSQPLSLTRNDVERITRRVAGASHVVIVNVAASFVISEHLGRNFSVFQGAVRAYPPNLPADQFKVPLFFPAAVQKINAEERLNGPFGRVRFADVLVREALSVAPAIPQRTQPAVTTATPEQPASTDEPSDADLTNDDPAILVDLDVEGAAETQKVSPMLTAAAQALELANDVAIPREPVSEIDLRDLRIKELEDELAKAKKNENDAYADIEKLEQLLDQDGQIQEATIPNATEQDIEVLDALKSAFSAVRRLVEQRSAAEAAAQSLRDEMDDLRREVGRQRIRLEGMERADPAPTAANAATRPPDYRKVEELVTYLRAKHGDKILLHNNAKVTLAEGRYEDSEHLIDSLDLLGSLYHAMKTGATNGRSTFHDRRNELRLKYSKALSETGVGINGKHYVVSYEGREVDPRNVWHVRNNAQNYTPERMMGLYFFWDGERKTTVVTSGPRKLPTSADST